MSTPDRYAVIGYPVKHSRSPFIHAMFARQTAHDMTYQLLEAPPERFHSAVTEFFATGGKGLNVTVPHKQAAFEMMRYRSPRAEFAGAVNTISLHEQDLMGDNTDGVGLLTDLTRNLSFALRDMRVLLLGAGGAARGVIAPLLQEQPAELVIANRNVERADQLVEEFMTLGSLTSVNFTAIEPPAFDLIINATSASLQGEMPVLPPGIVDSHTLCYDMAYGKDDTVFTRWAREQGAEQAVQGWGMLVEQAAESFYIWRGVRPDTAEVLKALQSAARAG